MIMERNGPLWWFLHHPELWFNALKYWLGKTHIMQEIIACKQPCLLLLGIKLLSAQKEGKKTSKFLGFCSVLFFPLLFFKLPYVSLIIPKKLAWGQNICLVFFLHDFLMHQPFDKVLYFYREKMDKMFSKYTYIQPLITKLGDCIFFFHSSCKFLENALEIIAQIKVRYFLSIPWDI